MNEQEEAAPPSDAAASEPIFKYLRRVRVAPESLFLELPPRSLEQVFGKTALYPRVIQATTGHPMWIFKAPATELLTPVEGPPYLKFTSPEAEAIWTRIP